METLLDGGAGVNSVTEEIVVGAINHAHARGIYHNHENYPIVQLERWPREERVTGIVAGQHVQILGAVLMRVEMPELGKETGPVIWVRAKIFAAGQSDWHGLILGGRALDSPKLGGLGFRPTPTGHAFESLGIMMDRLEDLLQGGYPSDDAYRMQVEVESAPGVFSAAVRRSLLDTDVEESCGLEDRAAASQPASGAVLFAAPQIEDGDHTSDYWEETEDAWVRHHLVPRIAKFTPVGVRGAPAVESLLD